MGLTNLSIKQGDATTLTEAITGLSSLTGYSAKMYITKKDGTAIATLTGTINALNITYEIVNEGSKAYAIGEHIFETKLYDTSDHVYTPSWGSFVVEAVINKDLS